MCMKVQRRTLEGLSWQFPPLHRPAATNSSRFYFLHIPKAGGSTFSLLLPRLLAKHVLSPVVAEMPEFFYPESQAAFDALM